MDKSEFDISKLKSCIESLRTCSKDYETVQDLKIKEYIEDACIKRYEFTVETAWKLMKK